MFCEHYIKNMVCAHLQKKHLYGVQSHLSAKRGQYNTVIKSELLMNPPEHLHDNRHNNFNVSNSQTLNTKKKYKACVVDFI